MRTSFKYAFFLLIPTLLACNLLQNPAPTVVTLPTNTPRPTFTPTLPPQVAAETAVAVQAEQPSATNTIAPTPAFSATNTPAATPLPTETLAPQPTATDTPPPPPTDTPVPPTNTPAPPPPPPTDTPVPPPAEPAIGQYGVSGKVVARDKTTFAVGEKAFFTYTALNHTDQPVPFGLLGIKASNGQFNTSWINPDVLLPNTPFQHDDGLTFDQPGTYQVFLAICYAFCDDPASSVWEEYPSGAATITVQ